MFTYSFINISILYLKVGWIRKISQPEERSCPAVWVHSSGYFFLFVCLFPGPAAVEILLSGNTYQNLLNIFHLLYHLCKDKVYLPSSYRILVF